MTTVINPLWIGAYSTFFVIQGTMGDIIQARGFDRWSKPIPDYLKPSTAWIQAIYTWYALTPAQRQIYNDYALNTGYSGFQFYVLDYVNTKEEPWTLPPVTMPVKLSADLDDEYTDTPHINIWWWLPPGGTGLDNIRRWAIYRSIGSDFVVNLDNLRKVVENEPEENPLTGNYHQLLLRDFDITDNNLYFYRITACNRFSEQSTPSIPAVVNFSRW